MTNDDKQERVEAIIKEAEVLSTSMRALFAGQSPEVIIPALAEALATVIAGHHPDLRDDCREHVFALIENLIPVCVSEMTVRGKYPKEWTDQERKAKTVTQ